MDIALHRGIGRDTQVISTPITRDISEADSQVRKAETALFETRQGAGKVFVRVPGFEVALY